MKQILEFDDEFIGRDWLFLEIDQWLADESALPIFLLTGEPGIGKTAAASRLVQFSQGTAVPPEGCRRIGKNFLAAYHFCVARRAETTDSYNFVDRLVEQLSFIDEFTIAAPRDRGVNIELHMTIVKNDGSSTGVKYTPHNPDTAFVKNVIEPLQAVFAAGSTRQVVIMVDGLDEAEQAAGEETIGKLLANTRGLPSQVRFLLTTNRDSGVLRHFLSQGIPEFLIDAKAKQNQGDIFLYLQHSYEKNTILRESIELDGFNQQDFTERVSAACDGNFQYLKLFLADLTSGEQFLHSVTFPKGLDQYYQEYFNKRLDKNEWSKSRQYLGIVAMAMEPLNLDQVVALSGKKVQDVNDALPSLNWCFEPGSLLQGKFILFHNTLSDYLLNRARAGADFWIDPVEVHRQIIDTFLKTKKVDCTDCDPYGQNYLPAHLMSFIQLSQDVEIIRRDEKTLSRYRKALVNLLTNHKYLDRKARQAGLLAVQTDIRLAARLTSAPVHKLRLSFASQRLLKSAFENQEIVALPDEPAFELMRASLPDLSNPADEDRSIMLRTTVMGQVLLLRQAVVRAAPEAAIDSHREPLQQKQWQIEREAPGRSMRFRKELPEVGRAWVMVSAYPFPEGGSLLRQYTALAFDPQGIWKYFKWFRVLSSFVGIVISTSFLLQEILSWLLAPFYFYLIGQIGVAPTEFSTLVIKLTSSPADQARAAGLQRRYRTVSNLFLGVYLQLLLPAAAIGISTANLIVWWLAASGLLFLLSILANFLLLYRARRYRPLPGLWAPGVAALDLAAKIGVWLGLLSFLLAGLMVLILY